MSTAIYAAPTKSTKASAPPASHRAGQHSKTASGDLPGTSGRPSQRSVFDAPGQQEASAVDTPFTSSLDDPDNPSSNPARLGYKDELERRFIWDRVIGRGQHGTVVRVVVDRADGTEYACKRMPKAAPDDCVPDNTADARAAADDLQLEHIRREIGLFTKLRSSLNVAKLEQVYEDKTHVYLVMEMCRGKTLAQVAESADTSEQEVSTYMRSVIRTIAQCHDKGEAHGAVAPGKFRLLSEDRDAQVKATGFGRLGAKAGARSFLSSMAQMAPEMLNRQKGGLGQNADTWAAGVLATRLLTNYFPFDDIIENAVDKAGFLPNAGPLADFFDNPLVPSGAALFVSATVMLLDFTRPHWQPVTAQAKDWVVRCLSLDPDRRQSAQSALDHPWIKGFKSQANAAKAALAQIGKPGPRHGAVVQRIQRFGDFSSVKQTALEHIAGNVLRQHSSFGRAASQEFLTVGDDAQAASRQQQQQSKPAARTSGAGGTAPLDPISEEPAAASPTHSLSREARALSTQTSAVSDTAPPSVHQTYGLLEHMMVSDGTINRFSLADGLAKLGYKVSDADLDHLLEQLASVPGLDSASAVAPESFAASQMDWDTLHADSSTEEWETMARAAFDALDLDGDGQVHRMELEVVLSGRCAENDIEHAIERAFVDAGQPSDAESMDFAAFMRLLGLGADKSITRKSIDKYASMKQCLSMTLPEDDIPAPSVQDVVMGACSSASHALAATVRRSRDFRTEPWASSPTLATAAAGGSLSLGGRQHSGSLASLGSSLPLMGQAHPHLAGTRRIACASSRSASANCLCPEASASADGGGEGGGRGPSGTMSGGAAHGDSGDHDETLRKLMLGADRHRAQAFGGLTSEASCPPSRPSC